MELYQSTQQATTDGSSQPEARMRRHNTLKERIKRSMNEAGGAVRRRSSTMLAAASALASLAGADQKQKATDTDDANIDMVDATADQPSSKGSDTHEERWRAASTAEEVPVTFPQKLMAVLDNDQLSSIITWLPHGKGFIILQKKKFASDVMPMYFKHSKFTSFTRKLNRWGFTRVSKGPETGAYYHKYFQRGNHHLCLQMHCQSKPNTSNSPRESPPLPAESSPKIAAAKASVPPSPETNVAAALSALRVEASPLNTQESHPQVDFKTTLSRQQELLREDKEDQRRKRLQQEHHQKVERAALAALYHSSQKRKNSPNRKMKEQVQLPSNLPPMPALAPSGGLGQNQSLLSSLSSSARQQQFYPSLSASFSAPGPSPYASLVNSSNSEPPSRLSSSFTASGTSPYASLRNSSNSEPDPHRTSTISPRAERGRLHQLQDIDWSKISNYSMQDESREIPDRGMVDQSRSFAPTSRGVAMTDSRQMMPPAPAPAYETMLNDYKRWVAQDTTSPTEHRHVIKNALDVLEASNDRGYSTMMMHRDHEKAQGRIASNEHTSRNGIPSRVYDNDAMHAQMRQLEGHNQKVRSDYLLADNPSRVEQLQQRMKFLSSAPFQPQVAPSNPPRQAERTPGGVRRASAA